MIDTFGRTISYLRLSVTELCNLRCQYCMPPEGVPKKRHEDMLTEDEMIQAVACAVSLGITKLRLTGGEPLIKPNILSICRRACSIPGLTDAAVTTNGLLLPELAGGLKKAGIRRLNISLDTLDAGKYARITRIGSLDQALCGIESALSAGFEKIKINCVLIGGFNDDEVPALAGLTRTWPVDVRFIELMPMPGNSLLGPEAFIPCSRVLDLLPDAVPEGREGVASLYRLPEGRGRIGLISPLSNHFCSECNRLRLTADGYLKPCLHSGTELCIKGLDPEGMIHAFREAIRLKPEQHDPLSATLRSQAGRSMNRIGG